MADPPAALELRGVSKRYVGTLAVDRVDLAVAAGEVHALVGENGAGKSTLMRIIAGSFRDTTGEILLGGVPVRLHSPAEARAAGIAMIHQELSLAGPLSVAENILAGRLPSRRGVLDSARLRREALRGLERVGLAIDPDLPVEDLSPHEAQLVEIAKALSTGPSILVMDEPTSALSRDEVERLFGIIRDLKGRGLAIVYISHHLPEIFGIADRVTVLRDGRRVETLAIADATPARLVELMVGRKAGEAAARRRRGPGAVRFRVEGASRFGFFHRVSFEVREGEILGIGGLAGAGRSELGRSLCGIDPLDEGRRILDGREIEPADLREAMREGLAYLSEDRKGEGLALRLTAEENALSALRAKESRRIGRGAGRGLFERLGAELQLHPLEASRPAAHFSGGNQQKILLAKELATGPEVLFLDEPTRGVDVGAKEVIHQAIARLADEGKAVVLISSDLPELVGLSDRIVVLRKGRLIREMAKGEFSEEKVLLAANGEA